MTCRQTLVTCGSCPVARHSCGRLPLMPHISVLAKLQQESRLGPGLLLRRSLFLVQYSIFTTVMHGMVYAIARPRGRSNLVRIYERLTKPFHLGHTLSKTVSQKLFVNICQPFSIIFLAQFTNLCRLSGVSFGNCSHSLRPSCVSRNR